MRAICILSLALGAGALARADFSYTTTTKSSGGMMGAAATAANNRVTKTYLKGQKMRIDSGDSITIMDFDAQTITNIDTSQKTYRVTKFSDVADTLGKKGMDLNIDIKETGQQKVINGYNASEAVMTMDIESPQGRQQGMKMRMEMELWISPDVPGAQEMRAFYQRNAAKFPWSQLAGTGPANANTQNAFAELRRKMAEMKGVPVLQVVKMGAGNGAQMAQMQQAMAQARAQLEEMQRQGKLPPQMQEQLKRMTAASSEGSMFETTMESGNFSTSSIPDSEFAIPAGYQQTQK